MWLLAQYTPEGTSAAAPAAKPKEEDDDELLGADDDDDDDDDDTAGAAGGEEDVDEGNIVFATYEKVGLGLRIFPGKFYVQQLFMASYSYCFAGYEAEESVEVRPEEWNHEP